MDLKSSVLDYYKNEIDCNYEFSIQILTRSDAKLLVKAFNNNKKNNMFRIPRKKLSYLRTVEPCLMATSVLSTVTSDLLMNKGKATWNLFVKY